MSDVARESRPIPMVDRFRAVVQEALAARGDAPTMFTTVHGKLWRPINYGTLKEYMHLSDELVEVVLRAFRNTIVNAIERSQL